MQPDYNFLLNTFNDNLIDYSEIKDNNILISYNKKLNNNIFIITYQIQILTLHTRYGGLSSSS
jgi:hypothetical protein